MKAEERWEARFRAPRMTLPISARQAPHHAVFRSNASGAWEIYAWDRSTGKTRQVTQRPKGTTRAAIDPTGQWIWWFDDGDGDEYGVWMRQPFGGGPDWPVSMRPTHPCGIALAGDGSAVLGRSCRRGFQIATVFGDHEPKQIYLHNEYAAVVEMSLDGSMIAISHSEHGDSRHPGLRVISRDGTTVGELWDGPGKGVSGVRFAPAVGDRRLLLLHERRGRPEPLIWDPRTGDQREIWLRVPGEIRADWYGDGRALLIMHNHRGRTELLKYDLAGGGLTTIHTPHGVIEAAAARPDGTVEYSWSSAAHPPLIRSSTGHVVMNAGRMPPTSIPLEDIDVEGPAGRIHALVSRPQSGGKPGPTVFLLHGGPAAQDDDSFLPEVGAWVDNGFTVIRVNYRGSSGYGSAWRDALHGDVGHIELADIAAVRDCAIERGIADRDRLILAGSSWGGYLALLGLGTQPTSWAAGIAAVPIADHAAAYEDEAEALRAYHRALLGGTPVEVPERYAGSSPITYADAVQAPVLILARDNDPRCPSRQLEHYIKTLAVRGHRHEVHRYDADHETPVVENRIRLMAAQIDFAVRVLAERE